MIIQFSKYLIPYLVALAITIPFLVIIFRLKSSEDLKITSALLICSVIWMSGLVLEIANVTLAGKVIFNNIGYLGLISAPVIFFILSAKLVGFTRLVKKNVVIAVSIIPAADLAAHLVNDVSALIQKNLTILPNGLLETPPIKGYEIASWVWLGYDGILILLSLIFLFLILAGRHKFFRRQALILLFSVIIVFSLELFYTLQEIPLMINYAPFAICLAWIIYWTFGYRYLSMGEFIPVNYESVIENINECVIVLNRKDEINFLNRPAQDLFSTGPNYMGENISSFWPEYILNFTKGQPEARADVIVGTGSRKKYFDMSLTPIKVRRNEIAGKLIILKDITERKEYEKKIKYMSFHDYLTGLYNRAFFEEELTRLNVERNLPLSIVLGDINGLKMVNDTNGHEKGDELLIKVAEVLKQSFRKSDIISRWGGDEFIILLPLTDHETANAIADRVEKTCSGYDSKDMPLSISLGISTKVRQDENIEEILKEAEDRMYANKMSDEKRTHRSMITFLEKSLYNKNFETEAHVRTMKSFTLMMGENLKLSEIELNELLMLSALHDVGKVAVDESIILKPEKLTPQEWEKVKKHPMVGQQIAKTSVDLAVIAEAILAHHENWNGSGYPEGIKGKEIPLISRIMSIVDVYDAMTSDGPYRKALSKEEAILQISKYSGVKYDPELVEVFLKIVNGP